MDHYLNRVAVNGIYRYMSWGDLKNMGIMDDDLWYRVVDYFCHDGPFRELINRHKTTGCKAFLNAVNFYIWRSNVNPSNILWTDKDFVYEFVSQRHFGFEYASQSLRSNSKFVLDILKVDGH